MIHLPPKSVWTPDVVFFGLAGMEHEEYENQAIYHDGFVTAKISTMTMQIYCPLKFKYFPFDTQV